jgi:hypothetical protein
MGRVPPPPVVVQVSPTPVLAGSSVTLSGSVGPEAAGSDCSKIILYSDAFAPTNRVGDMTAVYATATPSDAFSATTTIPRSKPQPPMSLSAPGRSSPGARSPCRGRSAARSQLQAPSAHLASSCFELSSCLTDQRAGQLHEPEQDVGAPLVTDLQPPVAHQPRQRPLDHIAVAAKLVARLDTAAGDSRGDAAAA